MNTMNSIEGYEIITELHLSKNSSVYRALRDVDKQPLILKLPAGDDPSPTRLARFRREYDITGSFNLDGIVKVYRLVEYKRSLLIELEDFGGESLNKILDRHKLDTAGFLTLAIRLAEILGDIHEQDIIHKDINPGNIVWNTQTGQVKIIDFGIAAVLSQEHPWNVDTNILEGALPYVSPEQTGRMNRALDYRSDFYSLGVTFYEILLGFLPFYSEDKLELIHSHLAKEPRAPHELNRNIPSMLSRIVMKLLAKKAEERYQSAEGLQADLATCLKDLNTKGDIGVFALGRQDRGHKFQIPQKLYGREQERKTLLAAFERASSGGVELTLVRGFSGLGKSALVHEIYREITRKRGNFIFGKFDQIKRDVPYAPLGQALREMIRQILTGSDQQIDQWRKRLQDHLGQNAGLMIQIVPELVLILGETSAPTEFSPEQAAGRFNLTCLKLVGALAQEKHPLVLFLDDLQWADLPSLTLIELFITTPGLKHFLIIGAYRENEIGPEHALLSMLRDANKARARVETISLGPLSEEHVIQLTADTLDCSEKKATPLARLCRAKTGGNPFFLKHFFKDLYRQGLIYPDRSRDLWDWDLKKIQETNVTDNVIALMTGKIADLKEDAQTVLKYAACIGAVFELDTLAIVLEKTPLNTARELEPALQSGLILPTDENYIFTDDAQGDLVSYRFLHDRVRQAAYILIPENQKKELHLRIGRMLLKHIPERERERRLFDYIGHLNLGRSLLKEQEEVYELVRINFRAGLRAKKSAAHGPAFSYLKIARELLELLPHNRSIPEENRKKKYELPLTLYVEAAEAAYLSANHEEVQALSESALSQARNLRERIRIYELNIQALSAQNRLQEATELGLFVLSMLGVRLPRRPGRWRLLLSFLRAKLALRGKSRTLLLNLPETEDWRVLAAQRILTSMLTASYTGSQRLFPLLIFEMICLLIRRGNTIYSGIAFAGYAVVLARNPKNIPAAYEFGRLSIKLVEKQMGWEVLARTTVVFYSLIRPWKKELRGSLAPLKKGYQIGLDAGDQEFAAHNLRVYLNLSFYAGTKLQTLNEDYETYYGPLSRLKQENARLVVRQYHQLVHNFQGKTNNPEILKGEIYNKDNRQAESRDTSDQTSLFTHNLLTMILACYFEAEQTDSRAGLSESREAQKYLEAVTASFGIPIFYFYDALLNLRACHGGPGTAPEKTHLKRALIGLKKMRQWARHAPMNFLHKYQLIMAEYKRVQGEERIALQYYRQAIQGARENNYIQEEALANELCAQFWLADARKNYALTHLLEARYLYSRWGAVAKVEQLNEKYAKLFQDNRQARQNRQNRIEVNTNQTISTIQITASPGDERFDLDTVLKASRAIGDEINLANLLQKMLRIVIENAGAGQGLLLLDREGNWMIEARDTLKEMDNSEQRVVQESVPANTKNIPLAILNYVRRTRKTLVLNDVARSQRFNQDEYIRKNKPGSILCSPIAHRGKINGIIYLENNLTTGAFTPERVEIVKMLGAQAAISIENAHLYSNLEERVKERTLKLSKAHDSAVKARDILEEEIRMARTVQESLLPHDVPNIVGLKLGWKYLPMLDVGGDFFDLYYNLDTHRLGFFICDISGHGVHAALLASMVKMSLQSWPAYLSRPAENLSWTKRSLQNKMSGHTMTACTGYIDINEGRVVIARAGHPPTILMRQDGQVEILEPRGRIITDSSLIEVDAVEWENGLAEGDRLVLYTDGIVEAINRDGEMLGDQGFIELLKKHKASEPEELCDLILKEVKDFSGNMYLADDFTLLVIEYHKSPL